MEVKCFIMDKSYKEAKYFLVHTCFMGDSFCREVRSYKVDKSYKEVKLSRETKSSTTVT